MPAATIEAARRLAEEALAAGADPEGALGLLDRLPAAPGAMALASRGEGDPSRLPRERAPRVVWSRVGLVSFWVLAFGLIATGVASSWEQIVGRLASAPREEAWSLSCPSCGESLGGSERCPGCGAIVAPVVHGALAPDPRTLPARPRADTPREIPGLRRREKNWQDEVRDRVRKRKKKRGPEAELPLFDEPGAPAIPEAPSEEGPVAGAEPEPIPETAPVAERREWVAPAQEERAPFEGRILDRVDPLDSLTDLPLQASEIVPPKVAANAHDFVAEFEAPPEGSGEQLERGQRRHAGLAGEFEASPEGSAEQLQRGQRRHAGLAGEFEASPEGSGEPERGPEAAEDDKWSLDEPLVPRLEPPPRLVDEKPVERPAQGLERAQAAAVDLVLLAALSSVVVYFASRLAHVPMGGLRPSWPYLASYLGFLALVYAVYFTGTTGQTLGKIVFGLRVVDTAGRPPGYVRAAGRAALGAVGVALAGLGLLPVLFDPARRAFHDRVLHTRVIRG